MAMPQDPSMMQAAPGAMAPEAETDDGGYTICIRVDGQNKISVSVENESGEAPESAEGPEGAEGSAQDPVENEDAEMGDSQQVGSIGDALRLAKEIYTHAGAMTESSASQDAMTAGYGAR